MNPDNYPVPTHDLIQSIYNVVWDIRNRVTGIETRLTNIEHHVGLHPFQPDAQKQPQPQQPHYQPHAYVQQQQLQPQPQPQQDLQLQRYISFAQHQQIEAEKDAEEERKLVAQMYQLPETAQVFGDGDIIAKPKFTGSKKAIIKNDIIVFLREEVGILQDDLDSMYEAFLQESRTHRETLEDAWAKNPKFFAMYGSIPPAIKTIEVRKFETNIDHMYKIRIGRCEKHWIADYFIHSVYNSIKEGNMGLSGQNSQSTLRHQASSSS
ncbi:hypothetical protein INT45_011247, partial [Circinella minor]